MKKGIDKMYWYKLHYSDGTYSHLASKKPILNKHWICDTCTKVELKSFLWYAKEWLIEKMMDRR